MPKEHFSLKNFNILHDLVKECWLMPKEHFSLKNFNILHDLQHAQRDLARVTGFTKFHW